MNEEWDKLWKDLQFKWTQPEEWEKQVKVLGDKLRERVEYLEGLTDGDVKLISKLQQENKMIQIKAMSLALQLEAIRNMIEEYRLSNDHSHARAHILLFKIDTEVLV